MKSELCSICSYRREKIETSRLSLDEYVSTENMLQNRGGIAKAASLPTTSSTQAYKKGDILVSNIRPYFKKIWKATHDGGCSNDILVFVAKDTCNTDFLYYVLSDDSFFDYATATSKGTKMPRGDRSAIMQYQVPIFDMETQQKIGASLQFIDAKICNNQQINDNLEQQASALFKSWFIDFKQVPNCDFVNSEIGLIPNDWRVYKLSDFLPVITGKKNANVSSDKGAYPFFSCSQGISWTNDYSFDGHAILVAGNGDFNVKWYNGKFDAYQRTYVLIPYNKRFTSWLYYAVKYNLFNITSAARGSVIKFITKGNLENFAFAGPKDLDSLDVIDTFTTINHTIDKKTQENYRLSALRDALLPKLMSGEIDVSAVQL